MISSTKLEQLVNDLREAQNSSELKKTKLNHSISFYKSFNFGKLNFQVNSLETLKSFITSSYTSAISDAVPINKDVTSNLLSIINEELIGNSFDQQLYKCKLLLEKHLFLLSSTELSINKITNIEDTYKFFINYHTSINYETILHDPLDLKLPGGLNSDINYYLQFFSTREIYRSNELLVKYIDDNKPLVISGRTCNNLQDLIFIMRTIPDTEPEVYKTSVNTYINLISEKVLGLPPNSFKKDWDYIQCKFGNIFTQSHGFDNDNTMNPMYLDFDNAKYNPYKFFASYMNTGDQSQISFNIKHCLPTFMIPSLLFHEWIPGHHFDITLFQSRRNLSDFKRRHTFLTEGWGQWAEYFMANHYNFYEKNDLKLGKLGYLIFDLFRSSRVLADLAIHCPEKLYFKNNEKQIFLSKTEILEVMLSGKLKGSELIPGFKGLPLAKSFLENEITRYSNNPGQSLSYKTGEYIFRKYYEKYSALPNFNIKKYNEFLLTRTDNIAELSNAIETNSKLFFDMI